ncbi:MAG: hypothetical protein V4621_00810 [Pseudomonadota bacterium]
MWLGQLPPDDQRLLVRLPYRVGLFLSAADTTGGLVADMEERQALRVLLTAYVQDTLKSQQIQILMEETIAQQSDWPHWGDEISAVPSECVQAITLLSPILNAKDLSAFKANLIEIALTVALAYREIDKATHGLTRMNIYLHLWLDRWRAFIAGDAISAQDEILNVSAAERQALQLLAQSLERDIRLGGRTLKGAA